MKKRLLLSIILGFGPLQSAINAQSVSIVKDLYTDNMNGLDEWNNKAIEYKDMLLFPGRTLATGLELYAIKSGELVLIKDINPGEDDSDPSNFFLYKDKVYFTARNDANGVEIWSTDGTEAGTQLTIEVAAGAEPTVSHDRFMVAKNGKLYFSQDNKAYVSDGTTGGTSVISNLSYVNFNDPGVNVSPASTTYKNGVAFVNNNRGDATIYAHDGTTLTPLKTLQLEAFTRVYGLAEVSHGLLYALEDSFNDTLVGLFLIDKTTGLVSEVKTATNESYEVSRMLSFNGKALFKMYGNDGIFATDGTTAGTVKIAAGNFTLAQLETWPHAVVSDKIVFLAGEPSFFNFDFYISDGT
ncbi:MAG TPA: hypothetical protein VL947_13390, partial [Cytophagales bacterium]|nr:hypothetical protein [Cytophagales bacterium]